ncbi:NAD(P)/FAD-dependent oxidoreductase [Euzebya tangerina]|uniref:NAD(P)/FAD-dependent oxidoreductase n=1 Tax=Euzebya tangerina TaxID=591198 RepID=UPI000E3164D6|nr:NAD(P)/FAD-dependent oxidoreductase [Euzebya tangerina]
MSVAIVGAGLAGLACATTLADAGVEVAVFEASDGVGGRVRSDVIDGFTLDRGFQVALLAYPEMHRQLDMAALDFQAFDPGAMVWREGSGSVVADPFRMPASLLDTVQAPVGSLLDKARIALLRRRVQQGEAADLLRGEDLRTTDALRDAGFSETIIQRFFTPLVGGIQLDPELQDSRRIFDIIFRMLAEGDSAVPADGMGAIPAQLAARLPEGTVQLGARVASVSEGSVVVEGGSSTRHEAVVVATEGPAAASLLDLAPVASKGVGCVYFAADGAPTDSKLIVLDGTGRGPVLNVAVMSNVSSSYAPAGRNLIAAAMPGHVEGDLARVARQQLEGWFGPAVQGWSHLRTYRIAHGQPRQTSPFNPKQSVELEDGRFVCGDHRDTASIQGALFSGRRCAEAVLRRVA